MELKEILKLMESKYPTNYGEGMNPVLFIYDDESGRIIKDAMEGVYEYGNVLFTFDDIDDLVNHLQGKGE